MPPTSQQQTQVGEPGEGCGPQPSSSPDAIARGLQGFIVPAVLQMDLDVVRLKKAQGDLGEELERLVAELQLFHDLASSLPNLHPTVSALRDARDRLTAANGTIRAVQDRIGRIRNAMIKTNG